MATYIDKGIVTNKMEYGIFFEIYIFHLKAFLKIISARIKHTIAKRPNTVSDSIEIPNGNRTIMRSSKERAIAIPR